MDWIIFKNENTCSHSDFELNKQSITQFNMDFLKSSHYWVSHKDLRKYAIRLMTLFGAQGQSRHLEQTVRSLGVNCLYLITNGVSDESCGLMLCINHSSQRRAWQVVNSLWAEAHPVPENKRKISTKTKMVIQLTALGLNTSEISDVLYLTTRGVDYHLDIAKKYFGAINKPNLIWSAAQEGWL
ncbi:helix-turn-helix transcriptional regulator [Ferrimonas kyonanensis]|uniref:helix-turn-helix transcriptional regulator n=1 Tax=Ferrimonas kyonanensis TaxID=364763 RepID=UPI0012EBCB13|nr:hypothetical protein [Ferrimonas kyonanensis]